MFQSLKFLILFLLVCALYACDSGNSPPVSQTGSFATNLEDYQPVPGAGSGGEADPPTDSERVPKLDDPEATTPPVLFLSSDWRFTASTANNALNLPELTIVRDAIETAFPSGELMFGTSELACETGNARATAQGFVSTYEFNSCNKVGVLFDGYYRVDSSIDIGGLDSKQKLDDDFDIRVVSQSVDIYIAGNSKLSILEGPTDICGYFKYERILRQDVLQVTSGDTTVNNLALENVVSRLNNPAPDGGCGLPKETQAFSGSATISTRQAGGEMFTFRANRNGILKTTIGQFVDAGENNNAVLTIYHAPTDAFMKVYAISLDNARVSIRNGAMQIGDFTADFTFK